MFGQAAGFTASFDLADLDGLTGLRLDGVAVLDQSGAAVAFQTAVEKPQRVGNHPRFLVLFDRHLRLHDGVVIQ